MRDGAAGLETGTEPREAGVIEFNGVVARFAALHAMGPTTLSVKKGEFIALVGPSGCGKSTLLNMVAGTLPPSSGEVIFKGRKVEAINHDVGYITQKNFCLPWRTVEANVRLPLEFRKMERGKMDRRVAHVLKKVGLNGFEKAYPMQLSGGMLLGILKLIESRAMRWQNASGAIQAENLG